MSITITIGETSKVFNKEQLINNCDYFKVLYENCIDNDDTVKLDNFSIYALNAFHSIFENHKNGIFPDIIERPLKWYEYAKANISYSKMFQILDNMDFRNQNMFISNEQRYNNINIIDRSFIVNELFDKYGLFDLASYFGCRYIMMCCALQANANNITIDAYQTYFNLFTVITSEMGQSYKIIRDIGEISDLNVSKVKDVVVLEVWWGYVDLTDCKYIENIIIYSPYRTIKLPNSIKNMVAVCSDKIIFDNNLTYNIDLLCVPGIFRNPLVRNDNIDIKKNIIINNLLCRDTYAWSVCGNMNMVINNLYALRHVEPQGLIILKNCNINIILQYMASFSETQNYNPLTYNINFIKTYINNKSALKEGVIKSLDLVNITEQELEQIKNSIIELAGNKIFIDAKN
jgi:hypothetical protein